ncbi:MAG: DUF2244 domain-containing protein [Micropepsaceae bacterium]
MSLLPFVITSRPYRSLGPTGLRVLLGVVIAANAFGAIIFLLVGAWPVSGFMGLDVLALYLAFRVSYAQMRAFERISVNQTQVTIECADAAGKLATCSLPSYWAQVDFEGDEESGNIALRSHGKSIPVGQFLPGFERAIFADTLRKALRDARSLLPDAQPQDVPHAE